MRWYIAVKNAGEIRQAMHIGIDYGSKMAGTTVLCWRQDDGFEFLQSRKGEDADAMILRHLTQSPKGVRVFLDAPLSLPFQYYHPLEDGDYFYRHCDKALGAMSPMFLGGLTARAMKLAAHLRSLGHEVRETYPAGLRKILQIPSFSTSADGFHALLPPEWAQGLADKLTNEHRADALLAWWSGHRFTQGEAQPNGSIIEGVIWI
jgi:uncharacterized protein